jgi:ABC-2 type transport system ATP-binding protein
MSAIIQVENLVKKYKKADKNAVDGISFTVHEGEFFAFLGPNGAGKTTTISILTTTLFKTSGEVTIAGHDIEKEQSKVRRNIGVIFQNPSLDRNLTAEENIRFHAVLYGLYPFRPSFALMPESYKKRIQELSEILNIENDIFKTIGTYSGGMKRKLEIVRGLMHRPKVLFLDEPTVGLDPLSRKNLWEYLTAVRKNENTTIFLTTHYLDEAENVDHLAVINHGKIVTYGTPDKVKSELIDEYLLIDAKDREKLKKELHSKHISFTEDQHIKVDISQKKVQHVMKAIDTELDLVQIHRPTLEDAYLEIIDHKTEE